MKQNKDREEFETLIFEIMMKQNPGVKNFPLGQLGTKLWSWIETHTQKKVKEALNNILEENHCDLDGTYDYDGIAETVIKLCKNK